MARYDAIQNGDGTWYVVREDGMGDWKKVMASKDSDLAIGVADALEKGEMTETDAIYEETGKPDAAKACVWVAMATGAVLVIWGIYGLACLIF